ncbi:sigma-70 family RNA polymerase sigma factor [Saccharothrix syringae]|uniref:Sigma-70 family RNA polymerase sigma factor n=1 Tax=Saccharothrix syringae TaxID=103733 RepID=A0A5Q0HBL1_SACSY|nr:sigma-70 family RNA polymerase sigma factor [Saccharothrix syringae]QFZ23559.1 sigma-70 family RNA polymerase sigma factor [Saccharothrix syringae]
MSGVTGTPDPAAANRYVTTALDKPPDLRGPDVTAAFAELFDAHARQLRGYLAGRVGESAADDLVAETFLVALKRRHSYDPERAPVKGWLYGIATNLVREHQRRETRGRRAVLRAVGRPEPDHGNRVAARVDAQRQAEVLARALADLRDEDRDALLLTSWAGLTPAEVAAALGENDSTVRSRLHRVRTKLQALLTEETPDA